MKNKLFGTTNNGEDVYLIELISGDLSVNILSFGAILQEMVFKNKSVVLGYSELKPYLKNPHFYGAVIGRFANRLKKGSAKLSDKTIKVEINTKSGHHIHGGSQGSCYKNWKILDQSKTHVTLEVLLPDGEMGFPGNLLTQVRYEILSDASLYIKISASTDEETLCSFAHHSYFNLKGEGYIWDHSLQVIANNYVDIDSSGIPIQVCEVKDSPFDFRLNKELSYNHILDHNFCISNQRNKIRKIACLSYGNISMDLMTTEPGLQVYTGHKLGIALEPQIWPDAPNNSSFPSALLSPNQSYEQETIFRFECENP